MIFRRADVLLQYADQVLVSARATALLISLAVQSGNDADFGATAVCLTLVQLCVGIMANTVIDQWLASGGMKIPSLHWVLIGGVVIHVAAISVVMAAISDGTKSVILLGLCVVPALAWECGRVAAILAEMRWLSVLGSSLPFVALPAGWLMGGSVWVCLSYFFGLSLSVILQSVLIRTKVPRARVALSMRRATAYFLDFLSSAGYGQAVVLVAAAATTPAEAATLRLVQSIFGLSGVGLVGLRYSILRAEPADRGRVYRRTLLHAGLISSLTVASGVVLVVALIRFSNNVDRDTAMLMVWPMALQALFLASSTLAPYVFKAERSDRQLVIIRVGVVGVSTSCVLLGLSALGAVGVAYGLAIGTGVGAVAWNVSVHRLLRGGIDARTS